MNVQTFPRVMICGVAEETGCRNWVSWPFQNLLYSQTPHGVSDIFENLKAQNAATFDSPKL